MKKKAGISLSRIAYFLIIICLSVYILIVTQFILAPLAFSVLFALLFIPISNFLEWWIKSRGVSVVITLFLVTVVLAGIITLFSYLVVGVFEDIPSITRKLEEGINTLFEWINQRFGLTRTEGIEWLQQNLTSLEAPLSFFRQGLSGTSNFLLSLFIMLVGTFTIMWYRAPIKEFILLQFRSSNKENGRELLNKIQEVVRQYLVGLFLVILILAVLNSVGLWLIGIGNAIVLGSLAALLVIIPYIGTTIGGLIPFLYSLATAAFWWQPMAVVALIFVIQQIEGNFITPNVVGSSVNVNFFVAIIALIIGGTLWGVSGVILSLPGAAILKLIFENNDKTKPLGLLMSGNLNKDHEKLMSAWDNDRHRLSNLFKED